MERSASVKGPPPVARGCFSSDSKGTEVGERRPFAGFSSPLPHSSNDRRGRQDERDKELGSVGIGPSVGHGKDSRFIVTQLRVEFVAKLIPRSASAGSGWIAALRHEVFDDSVEDGSVVKSFPRKEDKVINRRWDEIGEKSDLDIAEVGVEDCCIGGFQIELEFWLFRVFLFGHKVLLIFDM